MILSIFQRKKINEVIEKYSKNAEWVVCDENAKYKNTDYESLLYGIGTGLTLNHKRDKSVYSDTELAYYYQSQCNYFIQVFRNGVTLVVTVHKNMGYGLNGSKTVERIELLRNRVKPKDKCLTK